MTRPFPLSGPQSIRAAEGVRRDFEAREKFPFDWVTPPVGSSHVFQAGYIVAPAAAADTEIIAYTVPQNFQFYPTSILLEFAGAAYSPGDFLFSLTVNQTAGGSLAQGVGYQDYVSIPFNLGSRSSGMWPMARGEWSLLRSGDVFRAVVNNVNIGAGAPNYFIAVIEGYKWPA